MPAPLGGPALSGAEGTVVQMDEIFVFRQTGVDEKARDRKTGKVLVKKLMQTQNDTVARRELAYASRLKVEPVGGEIDLF